MGGEVLMAQTPVSEDFPRTTEHGAVPGTQPKLMVRKDEGSFVASPEEDVVLASHVMCGDLVSQLVEYHAPSRPAPKVVGGAPPEQSRYRSQAEGFWLGFVAA